MCQTHDAPAHPLLLARMIGPHLSKDLLDVVLAFAEPESYAVPPSLERGVTRTADCPVAGGRLETLSEDTLRNSLPRVNRLRPRRGDVTSSVNSALGDGRCGVVSSRG